MYKKGHCLRTPQTCTCALGIGILTVLEIVEHFLFKGGGVSTGPPRMIMATCHHMFPDTRNKNIYMVCGFGSQQFLRCWSTSGVSGIGPFRMVMISTPSNAPRCMEQDYIWFKGGELGITVVFNIFEHFRFNGYSTTPYGHNLHTIRWYLTQETRIYVV
jgi:hypothetical protein